MVFFDVVVVVDLRVVVEVEFFDVGLRLRRPSRWSRWSTVGAGSGTAGAVVVVDDAAAAAAAASKVPAVAPGRGSVLAGGAGAGDDVDPAEGLAGAASTGGDGGGTAVSGVAEAGAATSSAAGTDRAAWRARRTSGRDIGDTPAVEKRDETSCTPKSPRSTPVAVPRAHVTTRTRRTGRWCGLSTPSGREEDVKSTSSRAGSARRRHALTPRYWGRKMSRGLRGAHRGRSEDPGRSGAVAGRAGPHRAGRRPGHGGPDPGAGVAPRRRRPRPRAARPRRRRAAQDDPGRQRRAR